MCSPDVRQGPEGRPPNIAQPEGLGYRWMLIPSAVGAALDKVGSPQKNVTARISIPDIIQRLRI